MSADAGSKRATLGWTALGLAIALLSLPIIAASFRMALGSPQGLGDYLTREMAYFIALGALLWIILRGEQRSLTSVGWRPLAVSRSLLWGVIGALLCGVGLVPCLVLIQALGLHFGGGGKGPFEAPLWAIFITVLRAGIVEEVFYRGYAMLRLASATRRNAVAITVPLALFAVAHYRQGSGGILIALVMGGILAALFWKRRDLLAVITAHVLVDFVPNVMIPLFTD